MLLFLFTARAQSGGGGTATPAPIVGVLRLMELHDVRLRELHRPSLVERASVRLREVTR